VQDSIILSQPGMTELNYHYRKAVPG
jgi:hypothetical protein